MALHTQDLDPENIRDLANSASRPGFVGIVDEDEGGIIAYAHADHAARIIASLRQTAPRPWPKPAESSDTVVQRVCRLILATWPTAATFSVSSSDQDHYGYFLVSVTLANGESLNGDNDGTFEQFADTIGIDWLGDLSWGAFGDRGSESSFDVDVTTGKIIRNEESK